MPTENTSIALIRIGPHVRSLSDQDGAVLLDLQKGKYYSVNRIGARICSALSESVTRAQIVQKLREEFPISSEQLDKDVLTFLLHLQQKGLITRTEGHL